MVFDDCGDYMFKAVALDIDGTITDEKGRIPPESWASIKLLEDAGFKVILSSGNAMPVLLGLRYYSGASGAIVAENGGVVVYENKVHVIEHARSVADEARKIIVKELQDVVVESLQNPYRYTDYAFKIVDKNLDRRTVVRLIYDTLLAHGLKDIEVLDSGVAIHVHKKGVTKGYGLKLAAELMEINVKDIIAVGDSETDIPMFREVGASIAVGNAVEDLKNISTIVVEEPYYRGFLKAVKIILSDILKGD